MPPSSGLKYEYLADILGELEDGDLLLFRGSGFISRLISAMGRSKYTHAAKVVFWDDEPYCVEVREFKGGRAVTLRSQVEKFPCEIDVYETNGVDNHSIKYSRKGAVRFMRRLAGCEYGYLSVFKALLSHLPFCRLIFTPTMNDHGTPTVAPCCSEAVSMADRIGGGVDPVPNLADRATEPADLGRSTFYHYKFTLRG